MRDLLQQWRAAGQESNANKRLAYLRKLASSFHIDVGRADNSSLVKLSNRIGQEFVQRVSALRLWRPMGASTSGSAATAAHGEQSDAAELALGAEGMRQMLHGAPSMPFPWDDVQSPVRVMLNNRVEVNRVHVWHVYMEHALGVMDLCFHRWRAHLSVPP